MTMMTFVFVVLLGLLFAAHLGGVRADTPTFYRYDGTGNNVLNPQWGAVNQNQLRLTMSPPAYSDGVSSPAGDDRPSARLVSNILASFAPGEPMHMSDMTLNDMVPGWGQVIDHDITFTPEQSRTSGEVMQIPVPVGDAWFDPQSEGDHHLEQTRSLPAEGVTPRQQFNAITAFIDASFLYGSDEATNTLLRTGENGMMKTDDTGMFPPFNTFGLPMANPLHRPQEELRAVGDVRGNEQPVLLSLHTLFLREHNWHAARVRLIHPTWTDEQVFQEARRFVIAEVQSITYTRWLPALFSAARVTQYTGYKPTVNPGIAIHFSTAAYRFGHAMITPEVLRRDHFGEECANTSMRLSDSFFSPEEIIQQRGGIEMVLRGAIIGTAKKVGNQLVDELRNLLFVAHGHEVGLDLYSFNIQRGRDNGLWSYVDVRQALGLSVPQTWSDISKEKDTQRRLEEAYGTIDKVDLYAGGLAEDHLPGSALGELFTVIVLDQFERLRDGDRFFYLNTMTEQEIEMVDGTGLEDIIRRNAMTVFNAECIPGVTFRTPLTTNPCNSLDSEPSSSSTSDTFWTIFIISFFGVALIVLLVFLCVGTSNGNAKFSKRT